MKAKIWQTIFNLQLIVNILFLGLNLFFKHLTYSKLNNTEIIIFLVILLISLFSNFISNKIITKTVNFIQVAMLPYIFRYLLIGLISNLAVLKILPVNLLGFLAILFDLVIDIPLAIVLGSKVKNWFVRIVVVEAIMISYELLIFPSMRNRIVNDLLQCRIVEIIAFGVIAILLSHGWGIKFNWNLTQIKMNDMQLISLILLMIFSFWFTCFNQFSTIGTTLSEALFKWGSIFSSLKFNFKDLLLTLAPSFLEELERYLNIVILLMAASHLKSQKWIAVFGSALIFSLSHYFNLLAGSSFGEVTEQVVNTFSIGCLFTVIYLYTRKLWLTIIVHFINDFIGFVINSTPAFSLRLGILTNYGNGMLLEALIFVLPIIVTVLLLLFKNSQDLINKNISQIIIND